MIRLPMMQPPPLLLIQLSAAGDGAHGDAGDDDGAAAATATAATTNAGAAAAATAHATMSTPYDGTIARRAAADATVSIICDTAPMAAATEAANTARATTGVATPPAAAADADEDGGVAATAPCGCFGRTRRVHGQMLQWSVLTTLRPLTFAHIFLRMTVFLVPIRGKSKPWAMLWSSTVKSSRFRGPTTLV